MKDGFTCFTTAGSSRGSECGRGACWLLNIWELVYQVAFGGTFLITKESEHFMLNIQLIKMSKC